MRGRTFSREFKLDVARQVVTGAKRPAQACREYGLADSLLMRWRKEYEERGEEAFAPRQPSREGALEARVAELERYCGRLSLGLPAARKALRRARSARPGGGAR